MSDELSAWERHLVAVAKQFHEANGRPAKQRELAEIIGCSLGAVNQGIKKIRDRGLGHVVNDYLGGQVDARRRERKAWNSAIKVAIWHLEAEGHDEAALSLGDYLLKEVPR